MENLSELVILIVTIMVVTQTVLIIRRRKRLNKENFLNLKENG